MIRRLLLAVALAAATAGAAAGQIDPKTAMLERSGWQALQAGQAHAAAEAFREALKADPKNARLHLGAATAAFLERRDDDARKALERALALDARLTDARALLGQVFYRGGDLLGAIRAYEIVVSEAPNDADAASTLDRWRREFDLRNRMQQALDVHFTVSFEGPAEADLAQQALDALDRAYWRIGTLFGAYPLEPVPVVLYTTEQFRDITRSPTWAAAAYDGIIRVPMRGALEKTEELDRVLTHEFTHALVRSLATRGVPVWLNEGLAAALERESVGWAEARVRGAGRPLSLTALPKSFSRLTGDQAQVAYALSAVAAARLLDEVGGVAIANLLRDLGEGIDFDSAFEHRIQRSFADFASTLRQIP